METRYFEDGRFSLSIKEKALDALRAVDEAIIRTTGDAGRIRAFVLEMTMATTGAIAGAFFEYNQWTHTLTQVSTNGYPVGIHPSPQPIDDGVIGLAAEKGRPIIVSDISSPEWATVYCSVVPTTKSVLAFPICDKTIEPHQVIALIKLEHSEPGFFSQEHVDLLELFAVKALIGMNYGELLERNKRSIRALEALGVIAARSQSAAHDRNSIIWLFLTGVTAHEGLGFSRAMVFLKSEEEDALEGTMGIGELCKNAATRTWSTLKKEREVAGETGKDVLQDYLDHVEQMSTAINAGAEEHAPIARALKSQTIPLEGCAGALVECLLQRRCRIVEHDEHDPFRETLAAISGGGDRGSAFICVPIAFRESVMGVMVADNRWLPCEKETTSFDQGVLVTYANILAITLQNERLHKSVALGELFSGIGHDFNRQVTRLASVIASLNYELHKAPHVEEIFWNSRAGECFNRLLAVRTDIARFTRDFQAFGKSISLNRTTVELGEFVRKRVEEAKWEIPFKIGYECCPQTHLLELDTDLMGRAIDAVLDNAAHALSETDVSLDPHISVMSRVETDTVGCVFAVISIADNGPGVPQQRKQKIFQPFFTTRGGEGGSGLGLASARRYVEAHGGTLREVGKWGHGARFVIRLPLPPRHIVQNSRDHPS